ncbi:unnamed protein product, partial [Prorocentrum cordatum]
GVSGGGAAAASRFARVEPSLWQTCQAPPKNSAGRLGPRSSRRIAQSYLVKEAVRVAEEAMAKKPRAFMGAEGQSDNVMLSDAALGTAANVLAALLAAVENPIFVGRLGRAMGNAANAVHDFLSVARRETSMFALAVSGAPVVGLSPLLAPHFSEASFRAVAMQSGGGEVARGLDVAMPGGLRPEDQAPPEDRWEKVQQYRKPTALRDEDSLVAWLAVQDEWFREQWGSVPEEDLRDPNSALEAWESLAEDILRVMVKRHPETDQTPATGKRKQDRQLRPYQRRHDTEVQCHAKEHSIWRYLTLMGELDRRWDSTTAAEAGRLARGLGLRGNRAEKRKKAAFLETALEQIQKERCTRGSKAMWRPTGAAVRSGDHLYTHGAAASVVREHFAKHFAECGSGSDKAAYMEQYAHELAVMRNAIQIRNGRESGWRDQIHVYRNCDDPTVVEYRRALRKMVGMAPGTDGWRAEELLLLPHSALEVLIALFCRLEDSMADAPRIDRLRPISIATTAWQAWARCRREQIADWLRPIWLPTLAGGMADRTIETILEPILELTEACRARNLWEELAVAREPEDEAEHQPQQQPNPPEPPQQAAAEEAQHDLHIRTLDFASAFDRASVDIVLAIWAELGIPEHVLRGVRAIWTQQQKYIELGSTVCPDPLTVNESLPGDPLSILAMATLLCATYRRLNRRAPHGRHALCADDRTAASHNPDDLEIAEQARQELEQCTALHTAPEKTSSLTALAGKPPPQTEVKVLGLHLAVHGQTSQ